MMTIEQKVSILEVMSNCVPPNASGEDEQNLVQNFLPLRSYSKLADDKVFLITGGRGAGKTELFRILTSHDGLSHVISENDKRRYTNLRKTCFIVGYIAKGEGSHIFPTSNVCTKWIKSKSTEEVLSFWAGMLFISLLHHFQEDTEIEGTVKRYLGEDAYVLLKESYMEISQWWELIYSLEEKWESCLAALDELLRNREEQIFFTYDELDRICTNYSELFLYIRGLLSFWFIHNDRFSNIKAKIFLRSDLYNAKALQFVDSSKMRSYRLELKWDSLSLYRMLVKRLANAESTETIRYLQGITGLLLPDKKDGLGYLPSDSEEVFRNFIDKVIGKYMGKTPKRGVSYAWVPNHIQDGNGELAPRPFLKCFAFAAEELLAHKDEIERLEEDRLISPTRLQGALSEVSQDRVDELTKEEYQWLQSLIARLRGKTMLMEKDEFLAMLKPEYWEENEVPGRTDSEIFSILLTLGIIMETNDGRVNVPEIYLYGFGLKRKGGIKRPK